jgi:hypothetical protein
VLKYYKSYILSDFTLYEDGILHKIMHGVDVNSILKEANMLGGGKMYMKAKHAIEKINNISPEFINISESYFHLKHRNSRRLYKLYLLLNKNNISYDELRMVNLPLYKYQSENIRAYKSVFEELKETFNLKCSFLDNMLFICHNIDELLSHIQRIFRKRFNTHTVVSRDNRYQLDKLLNIYTLDKLKTYYTYYIFNKNSLNFTSFPISKFIKNIESIATAAENALKNGEEYHFLWVDDLYNVSMALWQKFGTSKTYGVKNDTFMLMQEPDIVNGHLYLVCNFYVSDLGVVYLDRAESNVKVLSVLLDEYNQLNNMRVACQ